MNKWIYVGSFLLVCLIYGIIIKLFDKRKEKKAIIISSFLGGIIYIVVDILIFFIQYPANLEADSTYPILIALISFVVGAFVSNGIASKIDYYLKHKNK